MVCEDRSLIHSVRTIAVVTCIASDVGDVKGFPDHRRISRGAFERTLKARMKHDRRVYGFLTRLTNEPIRIDSYGDSRPSRRRRGSSSRSLDTFRSSSMRRVPLPSLVYADGSICLDILQRNWSPTYDVCAILTSIRSLLNDPNPNSPANNEAAKLFLEDRRLYESKVRKLVEESILVEQFHHELKLSDGCQNDEQTKTSEKSSSSTDDTPSQEHGATASSTP